MTRSTDERSSARNTASLLARGARGGIVDVHRAAEILGVPRASATLALARLARRGWLTRARRGLYIVVPLEAMPGATASVEDPWVLAREIYSPCYVGGWSAAEHWGLTEQIFRSTFVVTAAKLHERSETVLGAEFHLVRVAHARVANVATVWRGRERVAVSDRERTVADALNDPGWLGGMRHLVHVVTTLHESPEWNPAKLLASVSEVGTGAAHKRLGFVVETLWPEEKELIDEAKRHVTAGLVKLDPAIKERGTINKRWGLRVNLHLQEGSES